MISLKESILGSTNSGKSSNPLLFTKDEYKTYNMAASASIVSCVIDKCIELGLLNEPENRLGSEGVLLVVEK